LKKVNIHLHEAKMNREEIYKRMAGNNNKSYELYLKIPQLLTCQTPFDQLVNEEELHFQIIHQVEELWFKLTAYTLLEIYDDLNAKNTIKALRLFSRVHRLEKLAIEQISLLETMSPSDYQKIRLKLGNGSGQESPGFQIMFDLYQPLYDVFELRYLKDNKITLEEIYFKNLRNNESYAVAEALVEFDELFQKFRFHHIKLVQRIIGLNGKSIKGRAIDMLMSGLKFQFYPKLWDVRNKMTDSWMHTYGESRPNLEKKADKENTLAT
jgi:tryptophan 2,3-dioxygenase